MSGRRAMAAPGPPGGNCAERVLRGGSWAEGPDFLRPRLRLSQDATLRISHTGFRLVRELK